MNLGLAEADFRVDTLIEPLRALAKLEGEWRSRSHQKSEWILHQGEVSEDIFILEKGLVKLVYPTAKGDEWIKSFIVDQGIFGSVGDVQQPSRFSAQCIEPSTLVRLPLHWVKRAIAADAALAAAYIAFSGWVRRRKEEREETLLCQSPEQSYRHFLSHNRETVERLPQGDIARYLGITPIAFSRIKRRMGL